MFNEETFSSEEPADTLAPEEETQPEEFKQGDDGL